MLEAYHKLKKAINHCGTSNDIAQDLEQTSSEAGGKGCSELSQAFAGIRKAGGQFEHFI